MRAAEGAIEGFTVDSDEVALEVIGDIEPVGLCGSGLVDAVAEKLNVPADNEDRREIEHLVEEVQPEQVLEEISRRDD